MEAVDLPHNKEIDKNSGPERRKNFGKGIPRSSLSEESAEPTFQHRRFRSDREGNG